MTPEKPEAVRTTSHFNGDCGKMPISVTKEVEEKSVMTNIVENLEHFKDSLDTHTSGKEIEGSST